MNRYSVQCECGQQLPVSATMAGSQISCSCGRSVTVPTLSSLRKSAGESAIPRNTIETIREMIRNGDLPDGDICPYSGRSANDTVLLHIQCERSWVRGGGEWDVRKIIAYVLLFGWIGALIASGKSKPQEEFGRDTWIEVPLRISSDVRTDVLRMRSQRKLKAILRQTPIYLRLLQEFPGATITAVRTAEQRDEREPE